MCFCIFSHVWAQNLCARCDVEYQQLWPVGVSNNIFLNVLWKDLQHVKMTIRNLSTAPSPKSKGYNKMGAREQ